MSLSVSALKHLSARGWSELAAKSSPFSGSGMEFLPLGANPVEVNIVIHEVGHLHARPCWDYQNVFSPFWSLYYDLQSGHAVVLGERRIPLGPDRILLIPDHQLLSTLGTEPRPKIWIAFSHPMHLAPDEPVPTQLTPTATENELIQQIARLFRQLNPESKRRRIYHSSPALLHVLMARLEIRVEPEVPYNLLDVMRYIEQRFACALYSHDLAHMAGMSEMHFAVNSRKFRGVSPARFFAPMSGPTRRHIC